MFSILFLLFVSTFVPVSQDVAVLIIRFPISLTIAFVPWLILFLIYDKKIKEAGRIQKAIAPYLKFPKSKIAILEAGLDYETVARAIFGMATTNMDGYLGVCHLEDFLSHKVD